MAVFSGNGLVGSPSFTFSSDTDTGIYRVGSDIIGLTAGGVAALTADGSGFIGIGTSQQGQALTIRKGANYEQIDLGINNTNNSAQRVGLNFRNYANNDYFGLLQAADTAGTVAQMFVGGINKAPNATVFFNAATYGGTPAEVGRMTAGATAFQLGANNSTPVHVTTSSGYSYNSSRFTAPQICVSDNDNFDTQTATSVPNYAILSKSFTYNDTVNFLDAVEVGIRGAFKITVTGDEASNGGYGLHVSESWVVCSNNYTTNAAPTVIINGAALGLDVQWKTSGTSTTANVNYRTLQVRPQSAAANFFTVTVEVFGRYSLGTAYVTFA